MFAITATGWRSIEQAADAMPGETVVDAVPQSLIDSLALAAAQKTTNAGALRSQADQALDGLRAYRDNAAPTNAQTVSAVKLLCRVAIALIRLQIAKLDSTD